MLICIHDGLPYINLTIVHHGLQLNLTHVLLDTGHRFCRYDYFF